MPFIDHHIMLHSIIKFSGLSNPVENLNEAVLLAMRYRIRSEIIGDWLYCFTSPIIGFMLLGLGFWYSFKHRAYVYSGNERAGKPDLESLDHIRYRLGSHTII
jgi:hypothetical protein